MLTEEMIVYKVVMVEKTFLITYKFIETLGISDLKKWLYDFTICVDKPDGVYSSIQNTVMVIIGNRVILALNKEYKDIDEYEFRNLSD